MWLCVAQALRSHEFGYYLQYIVSEQRFLMAYKRDMNKIVGTD